MSHIHKYQYIDKRTVLLEWHEMDIQTIQSFCSSLNKNRFEDIVPSYNSVLLRYHKAPLWNQELARWSKIQNKSEEFSFSRWKIPVCYDFHFALDLKSLTRILNLSTEEIITFHTQVTYPVNALGFLPGFPYLSGVASQIRVKRHDNARKLVPAGSVGIAGEQTGIYPSNSPGGWQIIGSCPLPIFNVKRNPPALFQAGDLIQFYSIDRDEYEQIKTSSFELNDWLIHD